MGRLSIGTSRDFRWGEVAGDGVKERWNGSREGMGGGAESGGRDVVTSVRDVGRRDET